jgi:hypothetical protein
LAQASNARLLLHLPVVMTGPQHHVRVKKKGLG